MTNCKRENTYIRNPYFTVQKQPVFEIFEKKDDSKKDWLLPFRKASFTVSSLFYSKRRISQPKWMQGIKLNLTDLLPKNPPYVPKLLQRMVNKIEKHLTEGTMTIENYLSHIAFQHGSADLLIKFLNEGHDDLELLAEIDTLPIDWVINMMKITLYLLHRKPLYICRDHISLIVKEPLSDKYRIPNIKIKNLVREACLRLNRSDCDTLAFMMIHIIHFWKYDYAATPSKSQLADVFGPLVLQFELEDLTTDDSQKSPEGALLEIILEMCDYQFWYQLSQNEVSGLFSHLREAENKHFNESAANNYGTSRPTYFSPITHFTSGIYDF